MSKIKLRSILLSAFMIPMLLVSSVSAEKRIIEAYGEYVFINGENPSVAKDRARRNAIQNASHKAAVFVENISIARDHDLTEDQIRAISASILKIKEEPEFKNVSTPDGNSPVIKCHVIAMVDDDDIGEKLLLDRESLDKTTIRNEELETEFARVKNENEDLKEKYKNATSDSERQKIRAQVAKNDEDFRAAQYFEIGNRYCDENKYDEAIANYTSAIELNPNCAEVYKNRGNAYKAQKILIKRSRIFPKQSS